MIAHELPNRPTVLVALAIASCVLASCAASKPTPVGPERVAEPVMVEAAPAEPRPNDYAEVRQTEPPLASEIVEAPESLSIRDDGRPSWWFSGVRTHEDRIALCAEALGPDMRATRSAAILAGRERLRRQLDLPPDQGLSSVHIAQAWVWPLPNAAAANQSNRYAGYVLISARVTN